MRSPRANNSRGRYSVFIGLLTCAFASADRSHRDADAHPIVSPVDYDNIIQLLLCHAIGSFLHALRLYQHPMDVFRVRLNCVDHYQANPTVFDPPLPIRNENKQGKSPSKVPVIRVFGATETRQKVCAHIHGAFPYLYIEYHGSLTLDDGWQCSLVGF